MDVVAISVGPDSTDLCKWDGRVLVRERVGSGRGCDSFGRWLDLLAPRRPFQLLARSRRASGQASADEVALRELAARRGAESICFFDDKLESDPGLGAARQAADRHRMGTVVAVEVLEERAAIAVMDARRRILSGRHVTLDAAAGPADGWRRVDDAQRAVVAEAGRISGNQETDRTPRVVFGSRGLGALNRLAAPGTGDVVLIPDYAATLGVVGMLLADRRLVLRKSLSPGPPGGADLRSAFAELMDQAADAVFREGCDLDDAEFRRFVEVSWPGASQPRTVECDAPADLDQLRQLVDEQGRRVWGPGSVGSIEVRGVGVAVTVFAPKPSLPPPRGTGPLEAAVLQDRKTPDEIPPETVVYELDKIPVGAVIDGPAVLRDRFGDIYVPGPGPSASDTPRSTLWRAEFSRAGGVLLVAARGRQ